MFRSRPEQAKTDRLSAASNYAVSFLFSIYDCQRAAGLQGKARNNQVYNNWL